MKWNYVAVIALFFIISGSSIVIGNFKLDAIELKYIIGINVIEALVMGIISTAIYLISKTFK